jgi:N utilization substance protein A
MDRRLAFQLAGMGIITMEDLAEQAIDDLLEVEDMTEERAGELIMTARAPWFEEAEGDEATADAGEA